jgi:hypothetical protein
VAFLDRAIPDRVAKQTGLPEHAVASSGVMRVDGNKKGVFTGDRRPKASVHLLRRRWRGLP